MQPSGFAVFHEAALEADEIRNSLLLSIIGRLLTHGRQGEIKTSRNLRGANAGLSDRSRQSVEGGVSRLCRGDGQIGLPGRRWSG